MEEFRSSIKERLGVLEEKVNTQSKRLDSLEDLSREMTKISTIMEMQTELNRDQQKQIREQHTTLSKINENLTGLNNKLDDLSDRVIRLEEDEDGKIDIVELIKTTVYKVIPTVIGAIIVAWLIIQFNLK